MRAQLRVAWADRGGVSAFVNDVLQRIDRTCPALRDETTPNAASDFAGWVAYIPKRARWGFIRVKPSQPDFFFRQKDCVDGAMPRPGDLVAFDVVNGSPGPRAINVRRRSQ